MMRMSEFRRSLSEIGAFASGRSRLRDEVTGLGNRRGFVEAVTLAAETAAEPGFAVLHLDLASLHAVNSTLGFEAGDRLLHAVGERLQAMVGEGDAVARIGGDEFAILCPAAKDEAAAMALAERLVDCIGQPFALEDTELRLGLRIGIALCPQHGRDALALMQAADSALHGMKAERQTGCALFDAARARQLQDRHSLRQDLYEALARNDLSVVYQPYLDLQSGQVVGCEALLRWAHPSLGGVPPERFIAVAEEAGLMPQIGAWVLQRACEDAASWPGEARISVNLSPFQLGDAALVDGVQRTLDETGLAPQRLELEVTESALLGEAAQIRATLDALHDRGVAMALDDFGTGYSSLSTLHRFPFDKLKIDRSFTCAVEERDDCAAIVHAIVCMGGALGLSTTAEGVETAAQRQFLKLAGCDFGQGFLFSRAVAAERVFAFLPHSR